MRVEIGPGPEKLGPEWTTVSVVPGPAVDALCEWGLDRLPFPDESVDLFYAAHVIEHLTIRLVRPALAEAWRVLRPGGVIELHTIDFAKVVDAYHAGKCDEDWAPWDDFMDGVNFRLFAYPKRLEDRGDPMYHRSCFDRPFLSRLLTECGFMDVEDAGEPRGSEKHGAWNLGVKAVRR